MSDIPPGWKLERVPPPAYYKLPPTEAYRQNWERIFGPKPAIEDAPQIETEDDMS